MTDTSGNAAARAIGAGGVAAVRSSRVGELAKPSSPVHPLRSAAKFDGAPAAAAAGAERRFIPHSKDRADGDFNECALGLIERLDERGGRFRQD